MGCGGSSNRVRPVASSSKTLTDLPVEMLHKIFDELDTEVLLTSLYGLSVGLDQAICNYDRYDWNLQWMSMKCFDQMCSIIRPEQVTQLTLVGDKTSSDLLQLFLDRFPTDAFVRLQSLRLLRISYDDPIQRILLPLTKDSVSQLSSIEIIENPGFYNGVVFGVLQYVLQKTSLRIFRASIPLNSVMPPKNCTVEHLQCGYPCSLEFLRATFANLPSLKTMEMDDIDELEDSDSENNSNDNSSESNNEEEEVDDDLSDSLSPRTKLSMVASTVQLTSLVIHSYSLPMNFLQWFVEPLKALKQLRLVTCRSYGDPTILDGDRWSQISRQWEKFQFVFNVDLGDEDGSESDQYCLSFRTPFWLDIKRWFVAYFYRRGKALFHTIPCPYSSYLVDYDEDVRRWGSTVPEELSSQALVMSKTTQLSIDASHMREFTIDPFRNLTSRRFPRVTQLRLYGEWSQSTDADLSRLPQSIDLSKVKDLEREGRLPTIELLALIDQMTYLQSIRTSTDLLNSLNAAKFCYPRRLRSFTVTNERQTHVNVEPFCAMFPRIQYLSLPIDNVDSCQYILDELHEDLIKVSFLLPPDDDDDNLPFLEWAGGLPEEYRCYQTSDQIFVWLK